MNPHEAAQRGDLDAIKRLVTLANVNAVGDLDRQTVLHIACRKGYTRITEVLIRIGADVDVCDKNGCTPLNEATAWANPVCVEQLLSADADPTIASNGGCIPLHMACNSYACAVLLIDAYPDGVHAVSHFGNIPLHRFAQYAMVDACRLLLDAGSRVDVANHTGITPLYYALRRSNREMTELFLERGARLDRVPFDGSMKAIQEWAISFVERRKACRSSCYAILELARRRSSVIGGNRRDALGLIARALWATRQEEEWNF